MPRFDDENNEHYPTAAEELAAIDQQERLKEKARANIKRAMDELAKVNPDDVTDAVDALLGKASEKMQRALDRLK